MVELWRPIPGWEGIYSVSDRGRVRRDLAGRRTASGRMKVARLYGRKYLEVSLHRLARHEAVAIHQVVAAAFIGPCPDRMEVCHLDGDRLNNAASNLRYDTRSANILDQVRHGTHRNGAKTHCKRGHPFSAENTYVGPKGGRSCRACKRLRDSRSLTRHTAAPN